MMMSKEKSNFHRIPVGVIDAQSDAVGIPIVKQVATPQTYEDDFKAALRSFKADGAEGLVTGDIYEVAGHEQGWLGRVLSEVGLKPIKPLWMLDTKQIYLDYLKDGFQSNRCPHEPGEAGCGVAWKGSGPQILR